MYNMWSPLLQGIIKSWSHPIDPLDIWTYDELLKIAEEAFFETIDKFAWELMVIHNLSLYEARYIIIKQLASK